MQSILFLSDNMFFLMATNQYGRYAVPQFGV